MKKETKLFPNLWKLVAFAVGIFLIGFAFLADSEVIQNAHLASLGCGLLLCGVGLFAKQTPKFFLKWTLITVPVAGLLIGFEVWITQEDVSGGNSSFSSESQWGWTPSGVLTAELRGDKKISTQVDINSAEALQFILRAKEGGISVYESWNSWGYFNCSFSATEIGDPSSHYRIIRRPSSWNANFPSTFLIKAGHRYVYQINFCDETWKITPALKGKGAHYLLLQGYYDVPGLSGSFNDPGSFADEVFNNSQEKPWVGHLTTNSIQMVFQEKCLDHLNALDAGIVGKQKQ
jgi:hypothetical protein